MSVAIAFDNSYARLPDRFYVRLDPTPVAAPSLVKVNDVLAEELGLDAQALRSTPGIAMLAGNRVPDGAAPLAMAYAGHQFGSWVPQLGDGRAILLGEVIDRAGARRDVQLKGSGPTPFSRRGDGRAALGPVLREYVISEAMHALGIPTTRALAAVTTGEPVFRERALPGAVLTRVARSHIRVGTFQYFVARDDVDALQRLADHAIGRHDPEVAGAAQPYRAFLDAVVARQATLVAQWLCVGFIHGVMNTDNMSIAGETIDYGPCAFMDAYHPATVYSSIDHAGRYAYGNQPRIAQWNLARLAQSLLPLLGPTEEAAVAEAQAAVDTFVERFETAYLGGLRRKVGLFEAHPDDQELINGLLRLMAEQGADFTNTFRALCAAAEGDDEALRDAFGAPEPVEAWLDAWRNRLARESVPASARAQAMRCANPAVIPRNHRVEAALTAAVDGDLGPFETLLGALADPYETRDETALYSRPPAPDEVVQATFCGT